MAQKKRGSNPIRITLTEDQISDIIQSAAKTRRGLKVENLEERIAPSAIGVPMFDPNLPGDQPPVYDPANPPPQGFFGEPPLPGPLPGDMDPEAGFVPPPVFDPNNAPPLDGPPLPGLNDPLDPEAGYIPPPAGLPGGLPGELPGGEIVPPQPGDFNAPGRFSFNHELGGGGTIPEALQDPAADGPIDPQDYQKANHLIKNQVNETLNNGGAMPTADEIDEHRRNILRQLRGA